MLTEEQAEQLKKQLFEQIKTLPESQKGEISSQIQAMNPTELEEFVKSRQEVQGGSQQSPFRGIVEGKIPSHKIGEITEAVAVLEINPVSKGHIIIIPRKPIQEESQISKPILKFAEKIAKKLGAKLKPKDVSISHSSILGEIIINVLPIYKGETPDSPRTKASKSELVALQKKLATKPKPKVIKKTKPKTLDSKDLWMPKRIP